MAISAHKIDDSIIALDADDYRCKAILSRTDAPTVSSRYQHITTEDIINVAREVGWDTFNYGVKKRNKRGLESGLSVETAGHFVAMRPTYMSVPDILDGGGKNYSRAYPTLMLWNNHDLTGRAIAELGIYEFICSNTSIVQNDSLGELGWRHSKNAGSLEKIKADLLNLLSFAPWIMKVRQFLSALTVTHNQARDLAERVIDLRWDGEKYSVEPDSLIRPTFEQQSGLSAYNVFQTVQRALTQGGEFNVKSLNFTPAKGRRSPFRKARKIKNFAEDRRINKGLWVHTTGWLNDMGYEVPND